MKNKSGNNSEDIFIIEPDKLKEILGENIEENDESKYAIQDDELRYKPEEVTEQEKEWLIELGIAEVQPVVPDLPIETGNYLVDGKYYDTLQEAIDNAKIGSEIMIINDTIESSLITINKNLIINTNGKTIDFDEKSKITINEGVDVNIKGEGRISGANSVSSFIHNYGNLTVNNVEINSPLNGSMYSTIEIQSYGNLISNNSNINSITCEGGTCKINRGVVGEIELSDDSRNINLTIGDINSQVNNTIPEIGNIKTAHGDIVVDCIINFYNGIIKKCEFDFNGEEFIGIKYDIRSGYKVQKNSNGITLVKE